MTTPNKLEQAQQRRVRIMNLINQLNSEIDQAHNLGVMVDIDMTQVQTLEQPHPRKMITATVYMVV